MTLKLADEETAGGLRHTDDWQLCVNHWQSRSVYNYVLYNVSESKDKHTSPENVYDFVYLHN